MPFHEIITDKSFANINAITCAFNTKTLPQYIEECFNILTNPHLYKQQNDSLVIISLCSSHTTKIMRDDVREFFAENNNEICRMIGNMFKIKLFSILNKYIENFIKIFMNPAISNEILKSIEFVSGFNDLSSDIDIEIETYEGSITSEESQTLHNAMYKNSKFFIKFNEFVNSLKFYDNDDKCEKNKYYNPGFIKRFLKNHISYIPLWTTVMTTLMHGHQPRANNGPIENFFMRRKRDVRQAHSEIGQFGHIKCGRYIDFASRVVDIDVKKLAFDIPARVRKNKKRGNVDINDSNILFQEEKYYKPQAKKSLFFGNM